MGRGREVEPQGMDPPPPLHQTMTWADRYVMAQPKPMLTHHQWGQVTIICLIFYTDVMNTFCIIFKKKRQVRFDIFFNVDQSKFKLWFISQKVSVIGKSNVTWLFAKFQVHLVQIRCIVNMTKLNSCAFGAHNLFKSIWCAPGAL